MSRSFGRDDGPSLQHGISRKPDMILRPDIGAHIQVGGPSVHTQQHQGEGTREQKRFLHSHRPRRGTIKHDINAASPAIGPQLGCNPFLLSVPLPPHSFRFFGLSATRALSLLRARSTKSTALLALKVRSSMPSARRNEIILLTARLLNTTSGF